MAPASAQEARSSGEGLAAISTWIAGSPVRPASAQALRRATALSVMSCSIGVVIQPSAVSAIQRKVFGPPPAPMTSGMWDCTGLGHAQDGPNDTNSPSYDASSWVHSARIASTYSRRTVRRFPAGTWWSVSSSVFQPKPAPIVTRPPDRWSRVAMALASVIGSDSTGSATAVDEPDPRGDLGGRRQRDPRVEGPHVAVVGQRLVAGAGVGGVAAYRDVGVLGHVERVEPPLLGRDGHGGGGASRGRW